jgi:long-chain fatty acid transport protein
VLKQLTVAPTVAYRLNAAASVGASLLLTGQSYKAEGLQAFASQSTNPAALTNQGEDYSYGVGLRIGGYWRVSPMLSLGTSWSPKVRMSKLDKYAGLLPDGGRLDVPESFVAGLQFSPSERVSILLDYKRINYADSSAFGNQPFNGTVPRGAAGGPGLAWKNMDVFKAGVRAEVTNQFRLSVGGSLNSEAFDEKDVSSNILTPATFRKHVTVALAYVQSAASEWSIFYNRSNGDRLTGPSAVSSAFATQVLGQPTSVGTETIEVRSQTAGIQFSRRL